MSLALAALALSACDRNVGDNTGTNTRPLGGEVEASSDALVQPVTVGESGARFDACQAIGTVRRVAAGETLAVRAAPFANAPRTGALGNGDAVFVCTRSLDQRWLGVVFDEAREITGACGVSEPIPARRAYEGPCASGWIPSAFVRLMTN